MNTQELRPKITLGYSTLAERAANIQLPRVQHDVEILVLIQNPHGILTPDIPSREDIRVIDVPSQGVAKSRNAAIREARGEYLIFADDDIVFIDEGLRAAVLHMEQHSCDLTLGQAIDEQGNLRKRYPQSQEKLTRFNSARAATYEMAIRIDAVRASGVLFDEDFGAGVPNYLGDEYIFIVDLLKAGRSADFVPITFAIHPEVSSGSGWGSQRDLSARSKVFGRVFGLWAPFVRAAFISRHFREVKSLAAIVRFIFGVNPSN